ncbi:trihelix transcription factor PTL-like [Senna tora]|uniref:Trihelix transcription factor PTL-like n=1 Tax=Senna tora TaxID=362788 RepID=A0A834WAA7_9FABA|nr:trihelix transcription factor PTL-like [Senna tora]
MGDPYPYPYPYLGIPDVRHLTGAAPRADDLAAAEAPRCLGLGLGYDVVLSHAFNFPPPPPPSQNQHHVYHYATTTNPTVPNGNSLDHHHHDLQDQAASAIFCNNNNNNKSNSIEEDEKGSSGWVGIGFDAAPNNNNRWPRQETLSLLDIRSRLDSKFRDTNHKGPLWNQISRIMEEEYGYQRSGKKCKEKFENLYKYYKKTKEGKGGSRHHQDGKHYRFFRQLEAICGSSSSSQSPHALLNTTTTTTTSSSPNNNNYQTPLVNIIKHGNQLHHHCNNMINKCCSNYSLSLLSNNNNDQFETSSSENNNNNDDAAVEDLSAVAYTVKQKGIEIEEEHRGRVHGHDGRIGRRSSSSTKVEELVDSHMRKIMESQEAWMEKMMRVVEQREQEVMATSKEQEETRKKRPDSSTTTGLLDRQVCELGARERAWIEARDTALMEVIMKRHYNVERKELEEGEDEKGKIVISNGSSGHGWTELEISNLIELRNGFEVRLHEGGCLVENNNNNNGRRRRRSVWDEIAAKMSGFGFNRSASECKQIWGEISISLNKTIMENR